MNIKYFECQHCGNIAARPETITHSDCKRVNRVEMFEHAIIVAAWAYIPDRQFLTFVPNALNHED